MFYPLILTKVIPESSNISKNAMNYKWSSNVSLLDKNNSLQSNKVQMKRVVRERDWKENETLQFHYHIEKLIILWIGVVHKWRHGLRGDKYFLTTVTQILKSVKLGGGSKIAWRHYGRPLKKKIVVAPRKIHILYEEKL